MANKQLSVIISNDLVTTRPDVLSSDCLRVECTNRVNVVAGVATRVNLAVHNTSQVGRMAQLNAQFDSRTVNVHIPNSLVYVGPEAKTVVYAIIHSLVPSGSSLVTFDAA
jgi:hypothetical protein